MTDSYARKSVLVTGASGFIGSHLCRQLVAAGAEVHAVTRQEHAPSTIHRDITWHRGELAESQQVRDLVAGIRPDYLFHLASEVTGSRDLQCVLPTMRSNLVSTVNLLVAVAEMGCRRIVLAGSLEEPSSQVENAKPSSPYAAAKWASSAYAQMFHALYQTPVTTARLFMVYGPGQQDLRKLVPYVVLSLLRGERPRLSSGVRPVDWIYVDDIVQGLMAMGLAQGIEGRSIELGSGQLVTTRVVVETLCSLMNTGLQPDFGALPDRPFEQVRQADVAQTQRSIGWKPSVSLEAGLRQTVAWYQSQLDSGKIKSY